MIAKKSKGVYLYEWASSVSSFSDRAVECLSIDLLFMYRYTRINESLPIFFAFIPTHRISNNAECSALSYHVEYWKKCSTSDVSECFSDRVTTENRYSINSAKLKANHMSLNKLKS